LDSQIWLMDPDGANEELLGDGNSPDWSPGGTQIVLSREAPTLRDPCLGDPDPGPYEYQVREIFRMNADGTAATRLTSTYVSVDQPYNDSPVWSPDGTRIAWWFHTEQLCVTSPDPDHTLMTMNPDGGQRVHGGQLVITPDWQPVQPGYPRPKSATLVRASLVPASIQCVSANRTHGPPLAFPSCNPPQQRSAVLTAGTPDANGAAPNMAGSVKLVVQPGSAPTAPDDAEVAVTVSITDVRCRTTNAACPAGAGSDYEGRLLGVLTGLRITDRLNTPPGPVGGPGTAEGVLEMPVQCFATADANAGSTCSLGTTVDALLPGAVSEGRRSVWELGQIHVRDAGPNGTGFESPACPPTCGDGDETLFLREGVFVP
jgi:hypothetical protein